MARSEPLIQEADSQISKLTLEALMLDKMVQKNIKKFMKPEITPILLYSGVFITRRPNTNYSVDLNTELVAWYPNGKKWSHNQMVCYSYGDLNTGLF